LVRPLQQADPKDRPDYVIHSYTKDLVGNGDTTAGVVIGRNADMFMPKGEPGWDRTLFWNVYYVKGAFLDADKAFEVLSGMKTLEMRVLKKCINTVILARWLAAHPLVSVSGPANPHDPNRAVCDRISYLGLPAALFTIHFDDAGLDRMTFERFFDSLSPMFGHMVSLGQSNTVILCPALTSHSEMGPDALRAAGISPTTIRISVGDEDPRELIAGFLATARLALDPLKPGFSAQFPQADAIDQLCDEVYLDIHRRHSAAQPRFAECLPGDYEPTTNTALKNTRMNPTKPQHPRKPSVS
jgi:cystathionine beta-lyase/cystathionine gamma-synthase